MNPIPADDLDGVMGVYVVANTPHYLFKHLRADQTVAKLAKTLSSQEIVKLLSLYAKEWSGRDEAVLATYALLVALSFKPANEYQDFLERYKADIRWLPELRGIILGSKLATSETVGEVRVLPQQNRVVTAANQVIRVDDFTKSHGSNR